MFATKIQVAPSSSHKVMEAKYPMIRFGIVERVERVIQAGCGRNRDKNFRNDLVRKDKMGTLIFRSPFRVRLLELVK